MSERKPRVRHGHERHPYIVWVLPFPLGPDSRIRVLGYDANTRHAREHVEALAADRLKD